MRSDARAADTGQRRRLHTVLMISRYFPPLYDIGGKRAYRFALHLPDHGWQPIILTGPVPAGYPADPTRLHLRPAVRVVRDYAPPWWPYRYTGLADGTRPEPIPLNSAGAVRRWLRALTTLPLKRDVLLTPRTARWARRLAGATPIDLVFATAPPWAVLAQGLAASRAIGAPLCLDLRDPWTFGFLHRALARWVRWVERRAEALLLARADRVIFTCDDTARAYRDRFALLPPERFAVIPNSFDPSLRPPPQARAGRPTIIHFGNCYGPRTLEPVVRALAALRRRGAVTDVRLLNLGRARESDLQLAAQLGVRDWIEYRPMLPYAEAVQYLAGADLQVLLAYGDETGHVPAKFFDYLLSGAPILCVARPSALTRLVEETGTGRCAAPNEVEAIAETIAAAVRRPADTAIARPRAAVIERFSAPHTTAQLAGLFDSILEEHTNRDHSRATATDAHSASETHG
jgi:glycosyltransferase involved in cell wall biosynthesis